MAASIDTRVARVAGAVLREQGYVSPIDVLIGLGWMHAVHRDYWQQGRVDHLEELVQVGPDKVSRAMEALARWAVEQGLQPSEPVYVARTRDRRELRFSADGDPAVERAYRIHWLSPELPKSTRARVEEKASRPPDLVVISPLKDWTCDLCGGTGDLLIMEGDGPLCLACADLDHLTFLPAGDAAVTRRARKLSGLSAVVVRFSRTRRRYERQGLLVEEEALVAAEAACLADAEARARRRARDTERRRAADVELAERLAEVIGRMFPGVPPGRAAAIAAHTASRGSGRIGRTAAGQRLDDHAVELAVTAAVRHEDTEYDALLMSGVPRPEARDRVRHEVREVLDRWRRAPTTES